MRRFEKALDQMKCNNALFFHGGKFDGAVLFLADAIPEYVKIAGMTYKTDEEYFDICDEWRAVLVRDESAV